MATRIGPTEDTPITPGWIETRLDEIIAALPEEVARAFAPCRATYLDCLAGTSGPVDPEIERLHCNAQVLRRLHDARLDKASLEDLGRQLEALEAELAART